MLFIRSVFYCPAGIDGLEEFGFGEAIQLHAYGVGGFTKFSGQSPEIRLRPGVQKELQEEFHPRF
jgi:hypothetical protein